MVKLTVAPGITLWREKFSPILQRLLLEKIEEGLKAAPLYRPVMPRTAKPFSVEQSNFGPLGWVSDKKGYRYQPHHPVTGRSWPPIPSMLLDLWDEIARMPPPQCCLVNFYREDAKMGLHQDLDEGDLSAPVVGISLGDTGYFRIGGAERRARTQRLKLASGDVIAFGGVARLAFHGIDRIEASSSHLLTGGGRLSLTLRRVGT